MTIEIDFFRQVMEQFATGVTVVTTCSHEGLAGLTVNSFTSVSLDPPLVLICIDLNSMVLSSEERYEHFCHASYYLAATGSPILDEALAFIDSRVVAEYPGGDHVIFLGQVVAMGTDGQAAFAREAEEEHSTLTEWNTDEVGEAHLQHRTDHKAPLAYYRGQYRHLARDYQRPSLAAYYDEDFE